MKHHTVGKLFLKMDMRRSLRQVAHIAKKAKKSYLTTLADILFCALCYGAGPTDYDLFELYSKTASRRKTYVTRGVNNSLVKKYNNPAYINLFDDKARFNQLFHAYVRREWHKINHLTPAVFEAFCQRSPRFIYKPLCGTCGAQVERFDATEWDTSKLFSHLMQKEEGIIEALIQQSDEMNALYAGSVNTVRIITFTDNQKSTVAGAFLRIGTQGNCVDNINHGGLSAKLSLSDGRIVTPAADKDGGSHLVHPDTKTPIVGFRVPHWDEVIKIALSAATVVPQIGYVGWDVAVCDDCLRLVEGNAYPGHDILQLPAYTQDGIGFKPLWQSYL